MKNTKKIHGTGRFLSLLLALCMILTFIPTVAFAQDSPVQIEVKNSQNGKTQYKVNTGDWNDLNESKVYDITGIKAGDNITIRAIPNEGQELDTTGTQLYVDGKPGTVSLDDMKKEAGWTFTYNDGSKYQVCVEYRGGGGNQNSNVEVQFDNATISGNVVTFNVDGTNVALTVNGADIQTIVSEEGTKYKVDIKKNALSTVTFTVGDSFNAETMQIIVRGAEEYNNVLKVNNKVASLNGLNFPGDWLHLEIEAKGGNSGPEPGDEPAHGGYEGNPIKSQVKVTGQADFYINDSKMINSQMDSTTGKVGYKGDVDYTYDGKGNVDFYFNCFVSQRITELVINGVDYYSQLPTPDTQEGRDALLEACKGQLNEFKITVPYSESGYNIKSSVKWLGDDDKDYMVVGNFLWTYTDKNQGDDYIDHGRMELINVKYNNTDYSPRELENPGTAFDWGQDENGGSAVLPVGAEVTVKLIPDYGYQLTSFGINGGDFGTGGEQSVFTFEIKPGNAHLGAHFTKVDDKVTSDSKKVAGGSINLGNKLEGGSAQLTVSDATLSSDKIAGFENAAGEYTISDYLDIDLYNVFYKGKDDADDVWSNKIDELDEYATITIKLEDGVNADDIVIVHNLHDGDKYEIINIDSYDPATNTITFKTKSFSAYAIATKGLVKVTEDQITDAIKDANNATKAEVLITVPKDQDVSFIELPVTSVKEIATNKKGLTIETKTATVTLDSKALATVAGKADGDKITLNLIKIVKEDLNEKQQKAIKDIDVDTIISAEILCGDRVISKDFGGGKATIKLPFTAAEGKKLSDYTIVYIDNDGNLFRVPTKVVDGNLVFEIEHFSEYAVALSSEVANVPLVGETPKTGDATNMLPWLGLMAIAGAAVLVLKRKED